METADVAVAPSSTAGSWTFPKGTSFGVPTSIAYRAGALPEWGVLPTVPFTGWGESVPGFNPADNEDDPGTTGCSPHLDPGPWRGYGQPLKMRLLQNTFRRSPRSRPPRATADSPVDVSQNLVNRSRANTWLK